LRKLRHVLEYLAYRAIGFAIPLLPRGAAVWFGRRLGGLYGLVSRRSRQVARENVARALPDLADPGRMIRESFRLQGVVAVDMLWSRRLNADSVRRYVDWEPRAWQAMQEGLAAGRGLVSATGHYGSWEMLNLAGGALLPRSTVIARAFDNPWIDARIKRERERTGNRLVYRENALVKCLSALRRNEIACSVIDMAVVPWQGAIFVDFFGMPALTSSALPLLAHRRKAPMGFITCRPIERGRRYLVEYEPIEVDYDAERESEVPRLTQAMSHALERAIRRHPEPWIWGYKRWKSRPSELPEGYPDYSLWIEGD
jgi:KDO2-lipid IV(A) lauroyltransferase